VQIWGYNLFSEFSKPKLPHAENASAH
jgi:hypothetical protein